MTQAPDATEGHAMTTQTTEPCLDEMADDYEVIRVMSKIVTAMRFDAIPAIAVLAGRKKNDGAAFTLRHLRSLVDEYDAEMARISGPQR